MSRENDVYAANASDRADALLSPAEISAELGIHPRTLRLWEVSDRFPHPDLAVGLKFKRWRRSTLDRWIAEHAAVA